MIVLGVGLTATAECVVPIKKNWTQQYSSLSLFSFYWCFGYWCVCRLFDVWIYECGYAADGAVLFCSATTTTTMNGNEIRRRLTSAADEDDILTISQRAVLMVCVCRMTRMVRNVLSAHKLACAIRQMDKYVCCVNTQNNRQKHLIRSTNNNR